MPLNIPTGTENNVSFGPGRVFMETHPGTPLATGSTPTTDVGWIGENGVTVELTSEKKNIVQGNPQLVAYSFCTSQTAMINFTSIQWDFNNFILALGAGSTNVGSGGSGVPSIEVGAPGGAGVNFDFGGNPLNTMTMIRIEHQMAVTGDTLYCYAWKAQSESGFSIPMTATEEHSFEFSFQVVRSTVDWCNQALASENQLIRFYRQTT